ncbi:MAG: hypothetical protein MPK62_01085 [Alphaproteobacteria bacterium]|nr:hypothetical protein [Alphaproteobacteria bacterium]MDA8029729.1 hypothetical protein [Alphaproteobacteria bacterium]
MTEFQVVTYDWKTGPMWARYHAILEGCKRYVEKGYGTFDVWEAAMTLVRQWPECSDEYLHKAGGINQNGLPLLQGRAEVLHYEIANQLACDLETLYPPEEDAE